MREINVSKIKSVVSGLCIGANINLRSDIYRALRYAAKKEKKKSAKHVLEVLVQNAEIARKETRPICQDTGIVSVYIRIGQKVRLVGGDLKQAINKGVAEGFVERRHHHINQNQGQDKTEEELPEGLLLLLVIPADDDAEIPW